MSGIFWLASYPKSGNTWMRAFLSNYWENADHPVNINALTYTTLVSDRQLFDDILGIDSGDLTQDEIDLLRPAVYRTLAHAVTDKSVQFWKIHDAFQRLPSGEAMFPKDITGGVIYIIRSPLDLAVSYAHHSAVSIDRAITWMSQHDHGLFMPPVRLPQLHQRMYSWSEHIRSWSTQTDLPLLTIRYEDMVLRAEETFKDVIRFVYNALGNPDHADDSERLARALRFSSFDELKKQEAQWGFSEKDQRTQSFFRKGVIEDWREQLTPLQVKRILQDHHDVMQAFGYLDAKGAITQFEPSPN